MLLGLPLLGVALAGRSLAPYLEFPPLTRYVVHAPFSWAVFTALTLFVLACLAPFVLRVWRSAAPAVARTGAAWPWWGWAGALLLVAAWVVAWNRFAWAQAIQAYTFTPIWLGYVVVINALAYTTSGRCMLIDRPAYLLGLFPVSAVFWWLFEYLNRFVQNWYYVGVPDIGAGEYFWQATLAFSTVLPAVLGTCDWLRTVPRLGAGLDRFAPIKVGRPRALGAFGLALAGCGLAGIGLWPDYLFAWLWLAPLLIIVSLQAVRGERTLFAGVARGDWRAVWLAALAALVCGFFWELWNWKSLAHWEYAVPFVDRFHLFEMPLLGYAGYLPFGLECAAVAELLRRKTTPHA